MASTYDKSKSTLQNASPDQLIKLAQVLFQIRDRLERNVMDSADVRDRSMLEGQLKTRKNSQDFNIALRQINAANARAQLAAASKIEATALKSVEDYATKYAVPNSRIEEAAKSRARENSSPGRTRFGNVIGVLIQRANISGMTYDRYNPQFLKTFESVVAEADPDLDGDGRGEFFIRNPRTGEVTGLTTEGRNLLGSFSHDITDSESFSAHTIAGDAIESLWSDYRGRKDVFNNRTAEGKAAYDKAQELKKKAMAETDGSSNQVKLVKAYGDAMGDYFNLSFEANQIGDLESVQRRVNSATDKSTTYRSVSSLLDQLIPGLVGKGPQSSKMGMYVSNPKFRQWAKDHGFESIGTGEQNKDGTWSYDRGGDDEKAFKLYIAQRKKSKFNYGFMRNAGTGETVQVTLKDGTTLSGERAKVHAGDPKDILRIITPEGDVEFINTDEDIEGDVVILKDAPEKKGIRERIMGRRGVRQKDETAALVDAAAEGAEGILEDVATVGEQYVQDKSGRYLSQDEYDKRREAVIQGQRSGHATMREVVSGKDTEGYLVVGDRVFRMGDKRGSLVFTEVTDTEEKDAALAAKPIRTAIKTKDGARHITEGDIEAGIKLTDFVTDPAEGTDEKEASEANALLDKIETDFVASATPEALGVRLSDTPGYVSEDRGERAGVTARTPQTQDLPEDPVEPGDIAPTPTKPWSPDDLDEDQKDAYDAVIARINNTYKAPPGFDPKQLGRLEDKQKRAARHSTRLDPGETQELNRLRSAAQQVKQRGIDIDTAVAVLNKLYSPLIPGEEVPDEDVLGAEFGGRQISLEDAAPPPPPPEPPKGLLSEAERKALTSPFTDSQVFSQLAERLKADPATTSFTMGEQLEVVDPDTKKRKLTDLVKKRQAVRPGDIVESSRDLGKLMQLTGDEDVDVYETDEGLYMAMQRGKPLPAGRSGRLLTDIKVPPPSLGDLEPPEKLIRGMKP